MAAAVAHVVRAVQMGKLRYISAIDRAVHNLASDVARRVGRERGRLEFGYDGDKELTPEDGTDDRLLIDALRESNPWLVETMEALADGETMSAVAKRNGISSAELQEWLAADQARARETFGV